MSSNEKIVYLLQYLLGAPKRIVEGYQFVQKQNVYTESKKTPPSSQIRKRLEKWPRIPHRDGIVLSDFSNFVKTCELAV